MIELLVGLATGCAIGATLTLAVWRLSLQRRVNTSPLPNDQWDEVDQRFAHHAAVMRQHVSEVADVLAGDDRLLRERLRSFEEGGRS